MEENLVPDLPLLTLLLPHSLTSPPPPTPSHLFESQFPVPYILRFWPFFSAKEMVISLFGVEL